MSGADLEKYLNNPSLLLQVEISELESIAREFPFFSVPQILLAKKYQQTGSPKFHEQLKRSALTATDRTWLYQLLHEPKKEKPESLVQPQQTVSVNQPMSADETSEMLRAINKNKQAILSSNEIHEMATDQTKREKDFEPEKWLIEKISPAQADWAVSELTEEADEPLNVPPSEVEVMNRIEDELTEQLAYEEQEELLTLNEVAGGGAEFVPTDFLDEEMEVEDFVVEQDAEIQSLKVIEEDFIARDADEERPEITAAEILFFSETGAGEEKSSDAPVIEEAIIDREVGVLNPAEEENSAEFRITKEVKTPGEFLPEKSYRFSQWLQFFRLNQPPPREEAPSAPKEVPASKPKEDLYDQPEIRQEFDSIDRIVHSIKKSEIHSQPAASAEELAKKSAEWDQEIVSETLAKIFEAQGYYEKAIRMYVKLSLKYPDKVSFFAARIKELKSKK